MAKIKFTKPTMNYAVGDVVELDKKGLALVDKYIDDYVEGGEDEHNRYVEVKSSKVEAAEPHATPTAEPPQTELNPAPVGAAVRTDSKKK